ncbi:MAG: hypothetical protein AAFX99_22325 [Myxococcota bacterium]
MADHNTYVLRSRLGDCSCWGQLHTMDMMVWGATNPIHLSYPTDWTVDGKVLCV